mgnify:CR=1 FL=1|tara:strand:+ start:129 stop:392 length:264 start_codon:yes stop_codon:yes gene_type:complete
MRKETSTLATLLARQSELRKTVDEGADVALETAAQVLSLRSDVTLLYKTRKKLVHNVRDGLNDFRVELAKLESRIEKLENRGGNGTV